jgi:hypothetical protein
MKDEEGRPLFSLEIPVSPPRVSVSLPFLTNGLAQDQLSSRARGLRGLRMDLS